MCGLDQALIFSETSSERGDNNICLPFFTTTLWGSNKVQLLKILIDRNRLESSHPPLHTDTVFSRLPCVEDYNLAWQDESGLWDNNQVPVIIAFKLCYQHGRKTSSVFRVAHLRICCGNMVPSTFSFSVIRTNQKALMCSTKRLG